MDSPFTSIAPTNLYAFYLKLRPLQRGTLMPFNGELVHAAWLDWLRSAAPDVASWLHEGNKRRLFTCSSLRFPFSDARMREAELRNTHMPLDPEKTCLIRITLLLGELFPLFHDTLTNFNFSGPAGVKKPPFLQLGKQSFLVEEVIAGNDDPTGWTGFISFRDMVEQARARRLNRVEYLELEFNSLTTFSRGPAKQTEYGGYHSRLPSPQFLFPGLARRWEELAPADYVGLVQLEQIEQYVQNEGVFIYDYELKVHQVKFTTHSQPGFIGKCKYALRGPDELTSEASPLTVRQQLILLTHLAFYSGVGYKTAMGMGQTRRV